MIGCAGMEHKTDTSLQQQIASAAGASQTIPGRVRARALITHGKNGCKLDPKGLATGAKGAVPAPLTHTTHRLNDSNPLKLQRALFLEAV